MESAYEIKYLSLRKTPCLLRNDSDEHYDNLNSLKAVFISCCLLNQKLHQCSVPSALDRQSCDEGETSVTATGKKGS